MVDDAHALAYAYSIIKSAYVKISTRTVFFELLLSYALLVSVTGYRYACA